MKSLLLCVILFVFCVACDGPSSEPEDEPPKSPPVPTNGPSVESPSLEQGTSLEQQGYSQEQQLAIQNQFKPAEKALAKAIKGLSQAVTNSIQQTKVAPIQTIASELKSGQGQSEVDLLYQEDISHKVNQALEQKYERKDLHVLKDKGLGLPREEVYDFKSLEGDFLQKNQALYKKLREANPYHVQGLRARELGFSAVKVADESYAKGDKQRARLAYKVAEKLLDVVLGDLPLDVTKSLYLALVGRDLLTGAFLGVDSLGHLVFVNVQNGPQNVNQSVKGSGYLFSEGRRLPEENFSYGVLEPVRLGGSFSQDPEMLLEKLLKKDLELLSFVGGKEGIATLLQIRALK